MEKCPICVILGMAKMGKVDSFKIPGCECIFRSEDHNPPHFHVKHKQDGWEIRVFIATTTEKKLEYEFKVPSSRKKPIPSDLQKDIRKEVVSKRVELMKEWDSKVLVKDEL